MSHLHSVRHVFAPSASSHPWRWIISGLLLITFAIAIFLILMLS